MLAKTKISIPFKETKQNPWSSQYNTHTVQNCVMYQGPKKCDSQEKRKSIQTNPPSDLYVGISKDVKVAIITINKVYSKWKEKRKSQQRNRNYYFKNKDILELENTIFST